MDKELFVVGDSEDTEAEYGSRSDAPFTLLSIFADEVYCVEGFKTLAAAKAALKSDDVPSSQITYL
jgi:hypothetical protein